VGNARNKSEDAGKSPGLFSTSSHNFSSHGQKKFGQTTVDLCVISMCAAASSAFSGALRVHWLAYPVATGINAGDDAACLDGQRPQTTGGLRAAGLLPAGQAIPILFEQPLRCPGRGRGEVEAVIRPSH
jgi:hypothetical protein